MAQAGRNTDRLSVFPMDEKRHTDKNSLTDFINRFSFQIRVSLFIRGALLLKLLVF